MQIGQFVMRHVRAIFDYCETHDPREFARLQDPRFSKDIFDINYPFCRSVEDISQIDQVRYWREEYSVSGIRVRVTNNWFNPPTSRSLPLFRNYMARRGIEIDESLALGPDAAEDEPTSVAKRAARGRYKGNAVGNAQNLLVRNLLSRLGDEHFNAVDWQEVVETFGSYCAYCGEGGKLMMDHVIPINKQALGEHRLGNLVPVCRSCNAKKAARDFREFLSHDPARITAIEAHMARNAYTPIGENEQLKQVIELAHREVRQLADRYVAIINAVLKDGPNDA